MTEQTPSNRFATAFDHPVPPLPVPGVLPSGAHPAFRVFDGVARGRKGVGRINATYGLVAAKVGSGGRATRVTLSMRLDAQSDVWWQNRVAEEDRRKAPTGVATSPRLLLVFAQGALRSALLLARRETTLSGPVTGSATFALGPDEVAEDGLLVIEVVDAGSALGGHLPSWAERSLAPVGAVGIAILELAIDLDPRAGQRRGAGDRPATARRPVLSTTSCEQPGLLSSRALPPAQPLRRGLLVLQPDVGRVSAIGDSVRVELQASLADGPPSAPRRLAAVRRWFSIRIRRLHRRRRRVLNWLISRAWLPRRWPGGPPGQPSFRVDDPVVSASPVLRRVQTETSQPPRAMKLTRRAAQVLGRLDDQARLRVSAVALDDGHPVAAQLRLGKGAQVELTVMVPEATPVLVQLDVLPAQQGLGRTGALPWTARSPVSAEEESRLRWSVLGMTDPRA